MDLEKKLDELTQSFSEKMSEETKILFSKSLKDLKKEGIDKIALKAGDKIPDFTLKNALGKSINSTELLKDGPLVISFYRGGWCPFCNLELKAYRDSLDEIKALGANFIAISPELPDNSLSSIEKHNLNFEVLSDIDNIVAKKFGLVFKLSKTLLSTYKLFGIDLVKSQGNTNGELPIPATYIVNQDSHIVLSFVNPDYKKRLDITEVLDTLKKLS